MAPANKERQSASKNREGLGYRTLRASFDISNYWLFSERRRCAAQRLVHRLAYNSDAAAGRLAVFQGASEAPISGPIRAESGSCRTEKQPTGRGPEGCVENGPAAALLVGYVSIEIGALLAPCRRLILNATTSLLFARRCTSTKSCRDLRAMRSAERILKVIRWGCPVCSKQMLRIWSQPI
jgi:hypothetical protein